MMLTRQEVSALVQLADRAPKSQAEHLWMQSLVERLRGAMATQQEKSKEDTNVK